MIRHTVAFVPIHNSNPVPGRSLISYRGYMAGFYPATRFPLYQFFCCKNGMICPPRLLGNSFRVPIASRSMSSCVVKSFNCFFWNASILDSRDVPFWALGTKGSVGLMGEKPLLFGNFSCSPNFRAQVEAIEDYTINQCLLKCHSEVNIVYGASPHDR